MLRTAHSARSALALLAASAASAALPARAEDQLQVAPGRSEIASVDERSGLLPPRAGSMVETPSDERIALNGPGPARAGRAIVSIGPQTLAQGVPRYAQRNEVAGTALVVSFASSPPREPLPRGAAPSLLPVAGRLTGAFGWRADPLHGSARFHAGVDIAAPARSPVAATADGSVASAGWSGGYGYMVILDHGNGVETRYAHMAAIDVEVGRSVRQGDVIGLVGSTGRSTGPHVHYELRVGGRAADPMRR